MTKVVPLLLLIIVLGSLFLFKDEILNFYLGVKLPEIVEDTPGGAIKSVLVGKKEILTPPPLRAKREAPVSLLTRAGVINWTNTQREQNSLTSLAENANLNAAAELKLLDMFEKQYFGHVSAEGAGLDYWVQKGGYEYIAVGENLALGNFKDDQELVQAWMDSPGHRANILNTRFDEIGVAVGKGTFEGKSTWLAVQVFGRPLSDCPQPSESLLAQIKANEAQLNNLQAILEVRRQELENMRRRDPAYNQKVAEYNALVEQYNNLANETKSLINTYNSQVQAFNTCLAG